MHIDEFQTPRPLPSQIARDVGGAICTARRVAVRLSTLRQRVSGQRTFRGNSNSKNS